MIKKLVSLTAALVLALGGVQALPITGLFDTAVTVRAEETLTWGDFEYRLVNDDLWIVKYNGSSKEVTIPNTINGKKVWIIGPSAFQNNETIEIVIIPEGTNYIGYRAFQGCSNLKSIELPDSITSIDYFAFYDCHSLTNVIIPTQIKEIHRNTFSYCENLTNIIIPTNIEIISYEAFAGCKNLSSITIPSSVTSIDSMAFGYLGDSFTPVEHNVFMNEKITDFKIYCYSGTAGEQYAKENGFDYELLDTPKAKTSLSKLTTTVDKTVFGYTGKSKAPTVTIKDGSYTLKQGTDYTLSYKNNVNIGTGTITVTGKGDYTGTKTLSFKIIPGNVGGFKAASTSANAVKLSWNKVNGAAGYIVYQYNTSTSKWVRVAKTGNVNTYTVTGLKAGTNYKYAIKAYKTVSGTEYSSASYPTLTTSTKPAKVSFTAKSSAAKKITYSWSKVTGATNYIVYYRVKGTSSWKSVKVANTVTARTITGLTSGKTYEVTVKAVRTTGGVTYNGAYDVKTVKVK